MVEEKKEQQAEQAQADTATQEASKKASAATQTKSAQAESEPKKEIKLSKKSEEIVKTVESMTVMELADLVKVLEDKFGVSAQMPVAAMMAGGAMPAGVAAEEEKTSFTVVLANVGDKKIQVIKEIRAVTTLGLKEAKDLVEAAPKTVKEGVSKEEAEKIKKLLEAQGAKVELK